MPDNFALRRALTAARVLIGHDAQTLVGIQQRGVELRLWKRGGCASSARLREGLAGLSESSLPTCHLELRPADVAVQLDAACDASGLPAGLLRQALVADVCALMERFAQIAGCATIRLRLEAITGNACRRWHRDCVPLRLITTYRGPGTEWVNPEDGPAVITRPDEDWAGGQRVDAGDVALFNGCGWPGQAHEGGIVHRSPRVAGLGTTRLVLVLNLPHGFVSAPRHRHAC